MSWKDLVTTTLAVLIGGLYYSVTQSINLPITITYRGGIALLALIGIIMCAVAGGAPGVSNTVVSIASVLGAVSFILILIGLISGSKLIFTVLSGVLILLWLISTARHLFMK